MSVSFKKGSIGLHILDDSKTIRLVFAGSVGGCTVNALLPDSVLKISVSKIIEPDFKFMRNTEQNRTISI
jgi:hypothetical protein